MKLNKTKRLELVTAILSEDEGGEEEEEDQENIEPMEVEPVQETDGKSPTVTPINKPPNTPFGEVGVKKVHYLYQSQCSYM